MVDASTRAMVERQILATASKHFGESDQMLLPPPPKKLLVGSIRLGAIQYLRDWAQFGLEKGELLQHLAIFGRSGAGKTNAVFCLLRQLDKQGIPWLFLDWKQTARHLLPLLKRNVRVCTPGKKVAPFDFNPFITPPGVERHHHVSQITDLLGRAYTLGDGAKSIIESALKSLDEEGVDPSIEVLLTNLKRQDVRGRMQGWMTSSLRALSSLQNAQVVAQSEKLDSLQEKIATLVKQSTIVELNGLNHNAKLFFVPSLLQWLYQFRLHQPDREQLSLVVILEEAHHVLHRQAGTSEPSAVERIVRLGREVGLAMVIVDQHPSLISQAALGNAYTTMCLNLKDPTDVRKAGAVLGLEQADARSLTDLPVGEAVVKLQGRWTRPFLLRIPHVVHAKGNVDDEAIQRLLHVRKGGSGDRRRILEGMGRVRRSRGPDGVPLIGEDGLRLLQDVVEYPDDGVKVRYKRLGISAEKGQRLRTELESVGMLESSLIPTGLTRKVVLRITGKGRKTLGSGPFEQRNESIPHAYWKAYWAQRLQKEGWRVEVETPRKRGWMDILARKEGSSLAVEIETGKSDVVKNTLADLAQGVSRVLVVATSERAHSMVEKKLRSAGLLVTGRVDLVVRNGPT